MQKLDPQATGRQYDRIAHHWQEPPIQLNGIAHFELAIKFTELRGHALDIGCGSSSRFIDLLLRYGFKPEGLDVSEQMIVLAKRKHPEVPFYQNDISEWALPKKYDFISAWDSTWHLPLEKQAPVLEKICQGLNPNGIYIFTSGGFSGPEEHTDFFMGSQLPYSTLGIPKILGMLTDLGCICRHLEYDKYPETHLCIIAQKL